MSHNFLSRKQAYENQDYNQSTKTNQGKQVYILLLSYIDSETKREERTILFRLTYSKVTLKALVPVRSLKLNSD